MHYVELAFGHFRSNGEPLPTHLIALAEQRVLTVFCQCFRGAQKYNPIGGWMPNGSLMIEPSTIIRAYASEIERHSARLAALARELREMLEQSSVLLVIVLMDGVMYWEEANASV